MKCGNCGASLDDSDEPLVRCPYCGTKQSNPEARAPGGGLSEMFADRDGDGVPDMMQRMVARAGQDGVQSTATHHVSSSTSYTVNGQHYGSLDEMPPAVRRTFEQSQRLLDGLDPLQMDPGQQLQAIERSMAGGAAPRSRLVVDKRALLLAMGLGLVLAALAVIFGLLR